MNAVANENVQLPSVQQMLQSMLQERFGLKLHRATKDTEVYVLRVGKNGSKLRDVKDDEAVNHGVKMEFHRVYSDPTPTLFAISLPRWKTSLRRQ